MKISSSNDFFVLLFALENSTLGENNCFVAAVECLCVLYKREELDQYQIES